MPSFWRAIREYLPDKRVLDERPAFDDDLSQPLFRQGSDVGCVVLHGIGGTPANVRVVADALVKRGYTVVSPALPGHGESVRALNASTDQQWLLSARVAVRTLREAGCERVYGLGLSLGGILVGLLAAEGLLDGLVMICAPLRMKRFLRIARTISPLLPVVAYPAEEDAASAWQKNPYAQMYGGFSTRKLHDITRLSRRLKRNLGRIACPTLIIAAAHDDKVDPSGTELFLRRAVNVPDVEYALFEDSPHGCTYGPEREAVAQRCAAFVASQVDKRASASV